MRSKKKLGSSPTTIVDNQGYSTSFFGNDTWNPDGDHIIDMSGRTKDLEPSQFGLGNNTPELDYTPKYFHIIPEIDPTSAVGDIGEIKVQLVNQVDDEYFIITANQLVVCAGSPMPYRIKKVYKTGTSVLFSIIW